jgi:L-lactate dehydrogenase complex protein LldF
LNHYLEAQGVDVVDTDLGERIVQLAGVPPSHIVMPAIHMKREEIGVLFHEKIGTEEGAVDPEYLTGAARVHLREKFLASDAALTGVNFAIAETGGYVVVTNEGNADLGVHLAPVHIASMGIEKVIPRAVDLGVFLRMLARSATGQPISVYSSHFHGPRSGQEMHLVIVDNGRSKHLGRREFWKGLKCIRCAACINTCPIYRRSGGYSYGSSLPGPIGSTLNPGVDLEAFASLPFASTLCGSCTDVCPVKIDLHRQLYAWRQYATETNKDGRMKRWALKRFARIITRPDVYRATAAAMRLMMRVLPGRLMAPRWMAWTKYRELPVAPKESFLEWYARERGGGKV